MMDTLISVFAEDSRLTDDSVDSANQNRTEGSVITNTGSFTNKLSKFTLATFDDQGNNNLFYIFVAFKYQIKPIISIFTIDDEFN